MKLATSTRNAVYVELLDTLGEKQKRVYNLLCRRSDLTNREIAAELQVPVNCVTGRVYELRQIGIVEPSIKRMCRFGRKVVQAWRIVPTTNQTSLPFGPSEG